VLSGHGAQAKDDDELTLDVAGGHSGKHSDGSTDPDTEYGVAFGHNEHEETPSSSLYSPPGHGAQLAWPETA
jgi:hypothetical protein